MLERGKKRLVRVVTLAPLLFNSEEDTGRGSLRAAMPTGEDKGDAALLTNPLLPKHTGTKIKNGNTHIAGSTGTH